MADTTLFNADSLGRPVKDLLDYEVKENLSTLEAQLNADRTAGLANTAQRTASVPNDEQNTAGQTLTTATAFDLFTIPVPDESGVCVEVRASIFVDDGTDHQIISCLWHVNAVNKGGTVTAVVTEGIADVVAASSGTLTLVPAAGEGAANILDVSVTGTTSLTPTTFEIDWQANVIRGGTITKVNANA